MADDTLISQEVVRGSDFSFQVTWVDAANVPLDFTGYTLSFFDESTTLTGRLSGSITNAVEGQISVSVEGTPPLPLGLHSFRVLLTLGTSSRSTKRLYLKVV